MTDTHFGWLLEDISDLINPFQILSCIANMDPKPDFILLTGDIGHFGCADDSKCIGSSSYWSPYRAYHSFVKLANNYGIDVYPVPGNHDRMEFPSLPFPSWFSDDCDNGLSCYNVQVTSLTNYDFEDEEHEGFLFIGLDSGSGYPPGEGLSTVQIDYIEDLGSKYPCTPKIVFMHHPGLDPEDLDIGTNQPKFLEWCKSNKVELVLHYSSIDG
jgi:3',5'-cyclic AMP phosphodiesterase CpdA